MAPSSTQDLFDAEHPTPKSIDKTASAHQYTAPDFELFRHLVPLVSSGKTTHLNAAFMPPSNLIVNEALSRFCSEALHQPSPKSRWKEDVEAVRELLGRYINTDPSAIAFVRDTTEGLGNFIRGLKFQPGDNVVILDCEHPNQAFAWLTLRSTGLEVRLVPTDPENPVAADAKTFAPYVDERTRAIGLSSIMFHTGQRNDVADVCEAFRHRGIHVLADLTQQVGFAAVDVEELGVSAAAFSLHKGLNSPTGFAALYVDTQVIHEMDPVPPIVGYGGVSSVGDSEDFAVPEGPVVFHPTAKRYEHANMSFISAVAARAFLQFYLEVMGPRNLEQRLYSLGDALRQSCAELGVGVVGPSERKHHAPHLHVLRLQDPRWPERLEAAGIVATKFRIGIRVSFGFYSNLEDVERLMAFKCSRTEPCENCSTSDTPCEYRPVDRKRVPASHEYVASLESRISWLETFVQSLRVATSEQREEMLNSTAAAEGKDHSLPSSSNKAQKEIRTDEGAPLAPGNYISHLGIHARSSANLELGLEGSLIYHGATSIFRVDLPSTSKDPRDPDNTTAALLRGGGIEANFESVMQHFGIDGPSSPAVLQSLTQFFRWQYPHFMFIYREAFLRDHFSNDDGEGDANNGRNNRKYWSPALLLSICALGALVSLDTKASSERFFLAAESIIMVTGLTRPSVATVQAFLCLALYEIGRGNLSKGWGYSGIAFRMAQDLGLQRDPKGWVQHDSSLATHEDVEIRRRIYWGCYISDKLISLILGRPVYLVYDDAEVQPMETLPEPPEMSLWRPVGFDEEYRESAQASSMIPYLHEQIRLSRIIERMMSTLFSPRSNLDDLGRRVCFDNLNLDLNRWRESLPDFAKWQKWGGSSSKTIPGVLALHVRIALNYDQAIASRGSDADEKPQSYCVTSAQHIISLVRTYRSQYGLQHAPLVFVYGAVQASRSAKAFNITEESQYLTQMLGELSSAWSLSREVMAKVLDC
ncbi:uncharacterized protein CCOS01_13073 [Colletotrichum costaricense]|uniref:Xylanolytic transcriptional activator regulatory domain-containing protein n=1 Tax=Colletotrichum costaricense TaxID=1209916 RepID=A0AAI9YMD9_9PEZI|nr:uncharacterized protein CCOS01_13073 [Colletotrichum costaricense]KAK1515875.1 hypothetical protein CCOS01_13073 [Colletotrichum costaricense]